MTPNLTKTGTTIVGLRFKNGIILASDTRSTTGPVVADKNCHKQHKIFDNMYAVGAGTAADTDRVTRMAAKEMTLFYKKYQMLPRICHAVRLMRNHLHSYSGHIGAALVIGGVDTTGAKLYSVSPHGYYNPELFTAMGSGSLAAITVLEAGFKKDMELEEAESLARAAIKAGILNDLYSGSNIDISIISKDEHDIFTTELKRNVEIVCERANEEKIPKYPLNSTRILKEDVYNLLEEVRE